MLKHRITLPNDFAAIWLTVAEDCGFTVFAQAAEKINHSVIEVNAPKLGEIEVAWALFIEELFRLGFTQ